MDRYKCFESSVGHFVIGLFKKMKICLSEEIHFILRNAMSNR